MIGIHINDSQYAYTEMILNGDKTMETRFDGTLHRFIGQRVAIIRTGKGPATIVGTVEIEGAVWYGKDAFNDLRNLHRVPEGSPQDVGDHAGKWCYILRRPMRIRHRVLGSKGYTGNRIYRVLDDFEPQYKKRDDWPSAV